MYDEAASLTDHATLYGMRLCNAIKSQRCLYDPQLAGYRVKSANNAAWKLVSKECEETVANCRFRWKTIRNAFSRSYKKYGDRSQYYLYAHLLFLIPYLEANNDKNDDSIIINEEVNKSLMETERNENGRYSDTDTTRSADESRKTMPILEIQNTTSEKTPIDRQQDVIGSQLEELNENHCPKTTDKPNVSFENNVIDIGNLTDRKLEDHNENQCHKTADKQIVHFDDNAIALETETTDSQPSLPDENLGRRLRDRKTPKRFIDMDFSPERSAEKRPRRLMQRRKSVGGLVLKEFALRNSLPDFPYTPRNENFIRPKPIFTPEILSYCDTTVDDHNLFKHNDKSDFKIYSDACVMAKPVMVDSFTITESCTYTISVGTQYEAGPRRPDDEFLDTLKPQMEIMNLRQKVNFKRRVYQALMEVLDDGTNFPNDNEMVEVANAVAADFKASTTSELRLMRELVSIVQAAKTTPELGEIGQNVTPVASAPVISLCTPPNLSPISTPPMQPIQTAEKQVTPPIVARTSSPSQNLQRQRNSPNATGPASDNPLGIPRHVIQKAVKVAGTSGSTIMTHDGDKRRVYRIYPKNSATTSSPKPGTQASTPSATQPSTFFVTPPNPVNKPALNLPNPVNKPALNPPNPINKLPLQHPNPINKTTINSPHQSNPSSPSNYKIIPHTTPVANRVVNTTTSNTMLPPNSNRSPAITNGVNKPHTMTPPQSNAVTSQMHGKIMQRRYSICGPAPTGNQPLGGQNKVSTPYIRTAVSNQQLPPLQRIQHFPQQQEFRHHIAQQQNIRQTPRFGPPAPNVSQFQMSKPVSLNTTVNNFDQVKALKHIPAINDNCRPRIVEPLPLRDPEPIVQPDPVIEHINPNELLSSSEASLLDMAGTIAADNFGSVFNRPIKDEPED